MSLRFPIGLGLLSSCHLLGYEIIRLLPGIFLHCLGASPYVATAILHPMLRRVPRVLLSGGPIHVPSRFVEDADILLAHARKRAIVHLEVDGRRPQTILVNHR